MASEDGLQKCETNETSETMRSKVYESGFEKCFISNFWHHCLQFWIDQDVARIVETKMTNDLWMNMYSFYMGVFSNQVVFMNPHFVWK